jgi:biotin carboxyl carrier protein
MKLNVEIAGKTRTAEIQRADERLHCTVSGPAISGSTDDGGTNEGRAVDIDAVELAPGTYSILIDGRCFEARVEANAGGAVVQVGGREYQVAICDPRHWRRKRGAAHEFRGRQQVVAPMPGKIVRVLVRAGDAIEAGRGILVVEAMKMQNEVRSPKAGKIERILVAVGQAVNAGEVLAVVD